MMNSNVSFLAIATFLGTIVLLPCICLLAWRRTRSRNPEFRFQYSIMDIWGITLGMAPTMWLVAQLAEHTDGALWILAYLVPHQLAGVFIFRLDTPSFRVSPDDSLLKRTLQTIGGVILGTFLPLLTFVILGALVLAIPTVPIWAPLVALVLALKKTRPKSTPNSQGHQNG
jgi:hypothetical protein